MDSDLKRTLIYFIPFPLGLFGFNGLISHFTLFDVLPSFTGLKGSIALILLYCLVIFVMSKIERRYDSYAEKAKLDEYDEA